MKRAAHIDSCFPLPTDLAAEFHSFPEFRGAAEYDVELQSEAETVTVRLHPADGDDRPHGVVTGEGNGRLFNTVLGCAVHAMSMRSDDVMVCNWGVQTEANDDTRSR